MYEFVGREYGVTADNTDVIEAARRTVIACHGGDESAAADVLEALGFVDYVGHDESPTTRGRYVPKPRKGIG